MRSRATPNVQIVFEDHGDDVECCPGHPAAPLDDGSLLAAVDELSARDPRSAAWWRGSDRRRCGHANPASRRSSISSSSSRSRSRRPQAAFDRLRAATGEPLTPAGLLALTDAELLAIGFSRQKTRYARALAAAVADGGLDLDGLAALDDAGVDAALTALPGHRSVDDDDLPADGAAAPGCVADPRHRPRPGVRRDPRPRGPAARRGDGRARRGLAAMARRRRADPVAPLPVGASGTADCPARIRASAERSQSKAAARRAEDPPSRTAGERGGGYRRTKPPVRTSRVQADSAAAGGGTGHRVAALLVASLRRLVPYFVGVRPVSRSSTIRCAASFPGAPITQPPGWVPEPHW